MQNMNEAEIDEVIKALSPLLGRELTEVLYQNNELALGFYDETQSLWVLVDLSHQSMVLLPFEKLPKKFSKQQKPISLFLKSRVKGETLVDIKRLKEYGRVVHFNFSNDSCVEIRLFPQGKNIIVTSNGKSVSLNKPKELELKKQTSIEGVSVRSMNDILQQWTELITPKKGLKSNHLEKQIKTKLKKLKSTLLKTEKALELMQEQRYLKLARALEVGESLASGPYSELYDSSLTQRENINRAYEKHKQESSKIESKKTQIKKIQQDIEQLYKGHLPEATKSAMSNLMEQSKAKGRRKVLQESAVVSVGKNAKDNIALIKKSKPWYIWLHVKDAPSAHAIIEVHKKANASQALLNEAAVFLLENTLRPQQLNGKWEIIYTECRFVSPIKGDKAGRVTYKNEKSFWVNLS